MAATTVPNGSLLAAQAWAKTLRVSAIAATWFRRFMSEDEDNVIQVQSELTKGPGDTIHIPLALQLNGDGVIGDGTLEGSEEAGTFGQDSLIINQLRHAEILAGRMTEQRTQVDLRENANNRLRDWWANRLDTCLFNQLCGNINEGRLQYTGLNIVPPTTATHYINAANSPATGMSNPSNTDSDVSNPTFTPAASGAAPVSAAFSLALIDRAVEHARTYAYPESPIRPLRINGGLFYVCFLHPYQVSSLRQDPKWNTIQNALLTGGVIESNPLFTGALGIYNQTILFEDSRIAQGTSYTTTFNANPQNFQSISGGSSISGGNNISVGPALVISPQGSTVSGGGAYSTLTGSEYNAAYSNGLAALAVIPTVRRAVFCGAQAAALAFGLDSGPDAMSVVEKTFDYGNQYGVSSGLIFGIKRSQFSIYAADGATVNNALDFGSIVISTYATPS